MSATTTVKLATFHGFTFFSADRITTQLVGGKKPAKAIKAILNGTKPSLSAKECTDSRPEGRGQKNPMVIQRALSDGPGIS